MALTDNRESRPWGPTRIALLGYGFATTVGFIYAQAYYGAFRIDILNYVDPIDLLFISLDHIDKVLVVTFLIVPVALIWFAVGIPVLLILSLVLLAVSVSVTSLILLVFSAMIPLGVGAGINAGRSLINRFEYLKRALEAMSRDKRNRAQGAQRSNEQAQEAVQPAEESADKPLRFVAAYREARTSGSPLKPIQMDHYLKKAKNVFDTVPKVLEWLSSVWRDIRKKQAPHWRNLYFEPSSWRPKPFNALAPGSRLLAYCLLASLLVSVGWSARRSGEVDAVSAVRPPPSEGEQVKNDQIQEGTTVFRFGVPDLPWPAYVIIRLAPWFNDAVHAICPAVPIVECESQHDPKAVYAIPTANVASLRFPSSGKRNERSGPDSARKARVSVRHGVREYAMRCLVYLGATGSMQFFTDLPSGDGCEGDFEPASPVLVVLPGVNPDVDARGNPADKGPSEAKANSDTEQPEDTKAGESRHQVAREDVPETERPAGALTVERDKEGAIFRGGQSDEERREAPRSGGSENEPPEERAGVEELTTSARSVVVVVGDPTNPGHIGQDWLPACYMKFVAWVGPFAEGAHDVGQQPIEVRACFEGVQRLYVGTAPEGDQSGAKELTEWWPDQKRQGVRRLVLVGRADREPISNDFHFSNFSLAQSRADWVKKRLSVDPEELHVLSIPGGPATPDSVDPCDRIVEIHMCSGPARVVKTDADDGVPESESRQEAGGGVGERR